MNAEGMRALVEEMCGEYAKVMPYATGYGAMAVADEEWQGQVSGWRARLDALLAEGEDQGETVLDGLTRIGMRHAGEGVRLLGPDDPIYPQQWLEELASASRVPAEYLRPENTAEQAKRFNREYYGTFPPEPPKEGE